METAFTKKCRDFLGADERAMPNDTGTRKKRVFELLVC